MKTEEFISLSEDETIALGFKFAEHLKVGDSVALFGDLGAGKTEFIKGICDYFNVEDIVNSPTFTIINQYHGEKNKQEIHIYHLDLYRIKSPAELSEIGFSECLHSDEIIKLIEWAEKAGDLIYKWDYSVNINLSDEDENKREIIITTN
jgi:tRNA threonylcarbamoyladenosine biosynthesis protein TsaE